MHTTYEQRTDRALDTTEPENPALNTAINDIAHFFTDVVNPRLFNPIAYIESTIATMVQQCDATPETKAAITSQTLITVHYLEHLSPPFPGPIQGGAPFSLPKSRQFKLFDIVTDSYIKQLPNGTGLRIIWPSEYPKALTAAFESADLQREYTSEIDTTFVRPEVEYISRLLIENELETILQAYLKRGDIKADNRRLVEGCLAKRIKLQTVRFYRASGVRLGQVARLAWPADSEHAATANSLLIFLGTAPRQAVLELPADAAQRMIFITRSATLKRLVLERLPLYERLKDGNDSLLYTKTYLGTKAITRPSLTFSSSDDIVGELYVLRLNRMLSDMDTLVSTATERFTDKSLELGVAMLQGLSMAVLLPAGSAVVAGKMIASFLLGMTASTLEAIRGSLADTPDQASERYLSAFIMGISEIAGPLAQKILGKALSAAAQSEVGNQVAKLLRRHYFPGASQLPHQVISTVRKPTAAQIERFKAALTQQLTLGPGHAQKLVKRHGQMLNKTVEGHDLVIWRGQVFRGDMRPPEVVFKEGFQLRTPPGDIKRDIHQVTGVRGGFGGGHDALDPDGKGISTSLFYLEENTGAFVYGGGKGGYTYLIDARRYDGYHLYANHYKAQYPKAPAVEFKPTEINYGEGLAGSTVLGAYDRHGAFIPNPPALRKLGREQAKAAIKEQLSASAAAAVIKPGAALNAPDPAGEMEIELDPAYLYS